MALTITDARAISEVLAALLSVTGPHLPTVDHDKARETAMTLIGKANTTLQGAGLRPVDVSAAWPMLPGAMNNLLNATVTTYTAETPGKEVRFGPRLDIESVRAYAREHGLHLIETRHEADDSELVDDYTTSTDEAESEQDAHQ